MIDGIPNRPLYFYQKDIIGLEKDFKVLTELAGDFWKKVSEFMWISTMGNPKDIYGVYIYTTHTYIHIYHIYIYIYQIIIYHMYIYIYTIYLQYIYIYVFWFLLGWSLYYANP